MTKYIGAATIAVLVYFLLSNFMPTNKPPYDGTFHWSRAVITSDLNPDSFGSSVYVEPKNGQKTAFKLEKGDECFFIDDGNWEWADKKDVGIVLVPAFCPKKGGGWVSLDGIRAFKASN